MREVTSLTSIEGAGGDDYHDNDENGISIGGAAAAAGGGDGGSRDVLLYNRKREGISSVDLLTGTLSCSNKKQRITAVDSTQRNESQTPMSSSDTYIQSTNLDDPNDRMNHDSCQSNTCYSTATKKRNILTHAPSIQLDLSNKSNEDQGEHMLFQSNMRQERDDDDHNHHHYNDNDGIGIVVDNNDRPSDNKGYKVNEVGQDLEEEQDHTSTDAIQKGAIRIGQAELVGREDTTSRQMQELEILLQNERKTSDYLRMKLRDFGFCDFE